MQRGQIAQGLGANESEELVTVLAGAGRTRVERIVSVGHTSPPGFWYDQEQDEFVMVVQGRARLEVQGQGEIALGPGDWVQLPAHERHRIAWTAPDEPTIWLAVFYDPAL